GPEETRASRASTGTIAAVRRRGAPCRPARPSPEPRCIPTPPRRAARARLSCRSPPRRVPPGPRSVPSVCRSGAGRVVPAHVSDLVGAPPPGLRAPPRPRRGEPLVELPLLEPCPLGLEASSNETSRYHKSVMAGTRNARKRILEATAELVPAGGAGVARAAP